ncbi:Anaphase promoting complex subunit 7, partial [Coemansia erecta]
LERSALTFRAVVESLVQCGRYKEAFVYAREMAELLPQHAGALAMVGMVLSHSPESSDKARRLLEAALDIDKRCAEAVGALASLHVADGRVEDAIRVVEKHLPHMQTDDMYTRYADVLTLANELPKAAVNYTAALTINPANERARAGLDRVDKLMHPTAAADLDDEEEEPVDDAGEAAPDDERGEGGRAVRYVDNPEDGLASSPAMLDYDELGADRGAGSSGGLFY